VKNPDFIPRLVPPSDSPHPSPRLPRKVYVPAKPAGKESK
jgi:hypothetical protein